MIPFFKNIFTSEAIFTRVLRSIALLVGTVASTTADWTDPGPWIVAAAGMLKAGDTNDPGEMK